MPPSKTQTTPNNKLTGSLTINSHELRNLSAVEITPAGNGQYAVTARQVLKDQTPEMFHETYKGKLHIVYCHPTLQDVRLQAVFLDFGVQDEKGECILSLYFRAQQEESALVTPDKPSIQLVK